MDDLHALQMASQRALLATLERALTNLAEVRAVLAPLVDEPFRGPIGHDFAYECLFCGADDVPADRPRVHEPDCPVRRRDALLGRDDGGTDGVESQQS